MADQKINELPTKTAPSTGDKMLMIGAAEEYQIDYDKLASAILDKLATKQYSELDTTAKTVLGALDELNSKSWLLQGGTSIPSNSDMDDYKTIGNYYCNQNAIASTLLNSPFERSFTMKLGYSTGSSYPYQLYREFNTGIVAYRYFSTDSNKWTEFVYFSNDATFISSYRIWRTVTVYSNGDFKDCNDIPVNCVGNTFATALNRPNSGTGQLFAIICIGSEADKYKAQYAFPSQTYINKIQYRFYNYTDQEWSEWTSI